MVRVLGSAHMKVVLFCGGLGMRMRGDGITAPKPMMTVGQRPILWHVMRYYAHYGHTDFILALGHGAQAVKSFFLTYDETESNDFVLRKGGREVSAVRRDIDDWSITFVDTGLETPIGERLRRVRPYLDDDEVFLANYGDVLTDAPLDDIVDRFEQGDAVGSLLAVRPQNSFHVVDIGDGNRVQGFVPVHEMPLRINGGYFVLRKAIFDYLHPNDDLVTDAAAKAASDGRFEAVPYDGFWAPMDTLKERAALEDRYMRQDCPWMKWTNAGLPEVISAVSPVLPPVSAAEPHSVALA